MILAIDPGLTTGWATWNTPVRPGQFESGMVKGRYEFYEWFYGLMRMYYHEAAGYNNARVAPPFQIVMEKFTITLATARKSPQPDPLYIIGHVDGIAQRDGIPLDFQLPSEAMTFATNEKLRAIDWYKPGPDHPNDAARHLLLWIYKHKPDGTTLLRKCLEERLGLA